MAQGPTPAMQSSGPTHAVTGLLQPPFFPTSPQPQHRDLRTIHPHFDPAPTTQRTDACWDWANGFQKGYRKEGSRLSTPHPAWSQQPLSIQSLTLETEERRGQILSEAENLTPE